MEEVEEESDEEIQELKQRIRVRRRMRQEERKNAYIGMLHASPSENSKLLGKI